MKKTTTTIEIIKVSDARIVSADVEVLDDGTCKLTIETEIKEAAKVEVEVEKEETKQENKVTDENNIFELVEASTLSMQDEFMKHVPETKAEEKFKQLLTYVIKKGLKDFYRPRLDPSFDENGEICYKPGRKPAVGRSYNWWQEKAKTFCSDRCSRLGTITEYAAFFGVLIKRLVASGWNVQDAWSAVCIDSKEWGHYRNSKNAKHGLEETGSREICGFFDLANTFKILAVDKETRGYWLAGGDFNSSSIGNSLADLEYFCSRDFGNDNSVGWLVLEK